MKEDLFSQNICYDMQVLYQLLPVGRNKLYEIVHSKGFPKITVGRRILVPKKALKKYGWLSTDHEKRYEKTVRFQKKPQKMVAVYKEFLFPCGSVEGGLQI